MTPKAQQIAIAKACGWTEIWRAERLYGKPPDGGSAIYVVPGYLHDLNACHEMEKVLTEREQLAYIEEIGKLVRDAYSKTGRDPRSCEDREVIFWHMTATATQRCDAFLRTLGLWREPSS